MQRGALREALLRIAGIVQNTCVRYGPAQYFVGRNEQARCAIFGRGQVLSSYARRDGFTKKEHLRGQVSFFRTQPALSLLIVAPF